MRLGGVVFIEQGYGSAFSLSGSVFAPAIVVVAFCAGDQAFSLSCASSTFLGGLLRREALTDGLILVSLFCTW